MTEAVVSKEAYVVVFLPVEKENDDRGNKTLPTSNKVQMPSVTTSVRSLDGRERYMVRYETLKRPLIAVAVTVVLVAVVILTFYSFVYRPVVQKPSGPDHAVKFSKSKNLSSGQSHKDNVVLHRFNVTSFPIMLGKQKNVTQDVVSFFGKNWTNTNEILYKNETFYVYRKGNETYHTSFDKYKEELYPMDPY